MGTNDVRQSHKQYVSRKKRIEKNNECESKIADITNEIESIDTKIKELQELKNKKMEARKSAKNKKLQEMLKIYNCDSLIAEIIEFGERTTYSSSTLLEIKKRCANGINEDNIDMAIIEKIKMLESTILKEIPHTNALGDLLNSCGEKISLPGEVDNENDA